jgi:hypothetical protein
MAAVRRSARVWIGVAGTCVVVAVLVLALSHGSDKADAAARLEQQSTINRVAKRVEAIRGLRYRHIPKVKVETEDEIAKEQEAEAGNVSAGEKAAAKRAEQTSSAGLEAYKLLGILPATFDPGAASGSGASDLAGIYDPRTNQVRLVKDVINQDPKLAEATLAHELDHALELQNYRDRTAKLDPVAEPSLGYQALQEGVATVVEYQYAKRYLHAGKPLREFLDRSTFVGDDPALPQALKDAIAFPYRQGGLFVDALVREAGHNSFTLADRAQKRPPESSAQILHPDLWRSGTPTRKVELDPSLGAGWKKVGGTDFGEFDTAALMRLSGSRSKGGEAAEGWAGGGFQLLRQGDATKACNQPCRTREALVIGWRWATADDADEQARLIPPYAKVLLSGKAQGGGVWKLKGGGYMAFEVRGRSSALGFAPRADQARKLVGGAL